MKNIVVAIILLCGIAANSQILTPVTPTTYGVHQQRFKSDSAQMFPEKTALVLNSADSTAQIFFSRLDSSWWGYSRLTGFTRLVSVGGTGGPGTGTNFPYVGINSVLIDSIYVSLVNDTPFVTSVVPHVFGFNSESQRLQYSPTFNAILTDFQAGDIPYWEDTVTIRNKHPDQITCNNSSSINLSYLTGLTYAYNSGPYSIQCIPYNLNVGGTVTLGVGTAGAGQFRFDLIYLNSTGVHVRVGVNSVAGVGAIPDIDPATEISLGAVRIDETNTFPTGPTSLLVYDENNPALEFTHTNTGLTINYSYNLNAKNGDTSIRITTASNNSLFRFRTATVRSSAASSNFTIWIRNNSIFANARNWVVRKMINNAQVFGSAALTLTTARGYDKTFLNTWMLISIPMSNFGGLDNYDGFEIRNTGTGGTVDEQFDWFKIEAGIPSGSTVQPAFAEVGVDGGTSLLAATPGSRFNILGAGGITTSLSGNDVTIDASGLSGDFIPMNASANVYPQLNGFDFSWSLGDADGSSFSMDPFSHQLSFNAKNGSNQTTLSVNALHIIGVGTYGSHGFQWNIDSSGFVYSSGVDTSKSFEFPFKRNQNYQQVLLYDSSLKRVAFANLSQLGIGGGGGGSPLFPTTGTGTATGNVTATMAANELKATGTGGSYFHQVGNEFLSYQSDGVSESYFRNNSDSVLLSFNNVGGGNLNYISVDAGGIDMFLNGTNSLNVIGTNGSTYIQMDDGTNQSLFQSSVSNTVIGSFVDDNSDGGVIQFFPNSGLSVVLLGTSTFTASADYSANFTSLSYITRKDAPQIFTGTSAPGTTPVKIGDVFVNTTGSKVYISKGTSSSADWLILN